MLVLGPVVQQQQDPGVGEAVDENIQEGFGLAVQPLQVLEQQHQRLVAALARQQAGDRLERALAPDQRIHVRQRRAGLADAQQLQQVWQHVFQSPVEHHHAARYLLAGFPFVVVGLDLEIVLHQLDQRKVGKGLAMGHRERLQLQAAGGRTRLEFMEQPRFADPGLADHRDDLPVSGRGALQRLLQRLQFPVAPDEARKSPMRRHLQARAQRPDAGQFVDGQRHGNALDLRNAQRLEGEIAFGKPLCGLADEDRRERRHGLHPRRDVDGVADRIVVRVQIVLADRAHDHFAGVDADPDLQRDALLQPEPVAVPLHRLLHAQRGVERALGVVLVGDRCAEQRQDAVAQ
ncbi:hypothetical protein D3C72_1166090 [compost metagenome]